MRLIDADAVEPAIVKWIEDRNDLRHRQQVIDDIPTVDAEPVRHGRWVMIAGFPACSECGCSPADWEAKPDNPDGNPPYCHSCGAKMDGGAEDASDPQDPETAG